MNLKAGELHVYVNDSGDFRPADEATRDRMNRLRKGQYYSFQYKRIRNYQFHKKYFAMLKLAFDNQEEFSSEEWLRRYTMLGIGRVETVITRDGKTVYMPESISFDKMDENEFEEVYQKTLSFLMERYGFDESFVDKLLEFC